MGQGRETEDCDAAMPAAMVHNEAGASPFVILCDHASNHIPARWNNLGLSQTELTAHVAWDPGAIEVATRLADRLDAAMIASTISRLVADCNRPLDAPDLMPAQSEAFEIPGNREISDADRAMRLAASYDPYHDTIAAVLARRERPTALVALHSFTPVYRGQQRPWHIGVIYNRDRRLAAPMVDSLREEPDLVVGINEPYSPADRVYYTLERHGEANGLACVMIEIRNDELHTADSHDWWADLLARTLTNAWQHHAATGQHSQGAAK